MWEILRSEAVRAWYERLKCVTEVDENQFGFMAGRSTTGAIFVI